MRMFKKNKKGFTLVELVIVIAVLAVLAAIAVPVATNIVSSAKTKADNASITTYQSAMEMYNANNTGYPSTDAQALQAIKDYTGVSALPAGPQSAAAASGKAFIFNTATNKVEIGLPGVADGTELQLSVVK